MSKSNARLLVIKRHGFPNGRLVICDEETGQPLEGQTSVVMESHSEDPPKVVVTFDAFSPFGVRFEDSPRQKIK